MVGCTSIFMKKINSGAILPLCSGFHITHPPPYKVQIVFKEMGAPRGGKWLCALKVMMSLEVTMQTAMDMEICSFVNRAGTWGPSLRVTVFL